MATGGLRSGRLRHVLRVCLPAACPVFRMGVYSRCALVWLGQAGGYFRGDGTLFAAGAVHGSFAEEALICLMQQGTMLQHGCVSSHCRDGRKGWGDQHVGGGGPGHTQCHQAAFLSTFLSGIQHRFHLLLSAIAHLVGGHWSCLLV